MWISPEIFDQNWKPDDWVEDLDVRRAVDWFTSFLKPMDWKRRRFAAFTQFVEAATGELKEPTDKGRFFDEKDRFAWYLLLGENWLQRPMFYDTVFGSRVIPVLIAIGRNVDALKSVSGIEQRVRRMVGAEKAQPNAGLFELLVAAAYLREGGTVTFLDERPGVAKTHDMDVLLDGENYAVECKRLETGAYTEEERSAARALWMPVARHFEVQKMSVRCDVQYIAELRSAPSTYLEKKAIQWLARGGQHPMSWSDEYGVGKLSPLNLAPLQRELECQEVAFNSTRMHELLLGKYQKNASIIQSLFINRADNPLFIKSCVRGTVCNWSSVSSAAVESKARDVLKRVSEGCAQIPNGRRGVVHIGLEAVDGDDVEKVRHSKVKSSLRSFDPAGKDLDYVYIHWFAPESPPDRAFDFEETRHYEAIRSKGGPPIEGFLVIPRTARLDTRPGGHWMPVR